MDLDFPLRDPQAFTHLLELQETESIDQPLQLPTSSRPFPMQTPFSH